MPTDADVAYALDLADEILGEDGDRWHTFQWLVADADADMAETVDCYWRSARLIADVVDTDLEDRRQRRAAVAAAYDLTYLLLDVRRLQSDASGQLRRLRELDAQAVRNMLDQTLPEAGRWEGVHAVDIRWERVDDPGPTRNPDDDADWDDEWAADRAEEWGRRPTFDPGWRARGIAQAALGAAVLARRSFSAWEVGHGLDDAYVQLLAALALLGTAAHETELALILALSPADVATAAQLLRGRALVEELRDDPADAEDRLWAITAEGAAAVYDWITRIVPLFAGWPPEVPGVDDASG